MAAAIPFLGRGGWRPPFFMKSFHLLTSPLAMVGSVLLMPGPGRPGAGGWGGCFSPGRLWPILNAALSAASQASRSRGAGPQKKAARDLLRAAWSL